MKTFRPFIALLALCLFALRPPTPAHAQTTHELKTVKFQITSTNYNNGLIQFNKRVKAALAGNDATDFSLSDVNWIKADHDKFAGDDQYGWGQIVIKASAADDAETLTIDFDFSDCDKAPTAPSSVAANPYKATNLVTTSAFHVAKGTKMSFSMGNGKRIKSIKFYTGDVNNTVYMSYKSSAFQANLNAGLPRFKSLDSSEPSTDYEVTAVTSGTTNNPKYCKDFTVSCAALYGCPNPLVWQVMDEKYGEMGTLYYNLLNFQYFDVTYYDDTEGWAPANDTQLTYGLKYATPILYKAADATDWTEATGSALIPLDDATVQVRLGNAITTFKAPATPKTGQPTVIIDPAKRIVGTTLGVTFFTEPAPELVKDGNTLYQVQYLSDTPGPNSSVKPYARQATNIATQPSAAVRFAGTAASPIYYADPNIMFASLAADGLTADNSTYTVKASGVQNPWASGTSGTTGQTKGTEMCVGFDGIRIAYTSNEPGAVQPPMGPQVTVPADALLSPTTGAYNIMSAIDVAATANAADIYPGAKVYYIISDEPLTAFDKAKATPVEEGKVTVDRSCYVSFCSYVTTATGELASGFLTYRFNRVDVTDITDTKQLTDQANKGKLVRLHFPLQVLATGYFTDTEENNKVFRIFARDTLDTPVQLVSRLTAKITTSIAQTRFVPSATFLGVSQTAIDSQHFVPQGGTVGTLEFDDSGRPVIVLKDEEKGIDNFELCYNSATVVFHSSIHNGKKVMTGGENFVRFTFTANRRTAIKAEDYGRVVSIDAIYRSADKTYTPEGASEALDVRTTATKAGQLGNINCYPSSSFSANTFNGADGTKCTISGIVAYDAEQQKYYLMPRQIVAAVPDYPDVDKWDLASTAGASFTEYVKDEENHSATGKIEMFTNTIQFQVSGTATTQQYYWGYFDKANGAIGTANVQGATAGTSKYLQFKTVTLGSEGYVDMNVYIVPTSPGSNMFFAASQPFRVRLYDAVSTAPLYTSIADVLKDAKEKPQEINGKYLRIKGTGIAVAAIAANKTDNVATTFNSMIIKDITPLKEGKADTELSSLLLTTTQALNSTNYPANYWASSTTTSQSVSAPAPGDSIGEISFKVDIDDSGNVTGNITNMKNYYKSNKACYFAPNHSGPMYNTTLSPGTPMFINYLTAMNPVISLPAAETQLTAEHIDKIVTITGVKIAKNEPAASEPEAAAQADAEEYVAKMKVDVPLQWNLFSSVQNAAANRSLVQQLTDGVYTLTGFVRANGANGHFIEVQSLTPEFGKQVAVCEHKHHDSYFDQDKFTITDEQLGKAIELKGMKLTREGSYPYTYKTVTNPPLILDFSAVSTMTSTWNGYAATGQSKPVRITGVLKATEPAVEGETPAAPYTLVVNTFDNPNASTGGNLQLTFNGRTWATYSKTNFLSSGKIGYSAPEGTRVYYTIVDNPDEIEYTVDEGASDADKQAAKEAAIKAALENGEEHLFTDDTDLTYDHTVWIRMYDCTPGQTPLNVVQMEVKKTAADITTIQEAIDGTGTNTAAGYFHVRKPWLVTCSAPDRAIVTDGSGKNVALYINNPALLEVPEAGKYISEFAIGKGNATLHRDFTYLLSVTGNTNSLDKMIVPEPATPIKAPEAAEMTALSTNADKGKLVALTDVKITGNRAGGFRLKAMATAGDPADKRMMETYPARYDMDVLRDIPLQNALSMKLDELLDDDEEAAYRMVGYVMTSNTLVDPEGITVSADHKMTILEFWPTEIIRRRKIEAPVITLSADKSMKAETATITCAEPDATIEYSVDGGTTWRPYTQALALSKSATIQARASKKWLDTSDVTTASFTMQHKSAAPLASFAEAEGVTTVTLTTSREGAAAGSYKVYYTLDGTEPTTASTLYADPFQVKKAGVKLRAILLENDPEAVESDPVEWTVPFTPAKQPENPDQPVTPDKSGSVTMTHRTDQDGTVWVELKAPAGADVEAIYYTTDGTTPTESSAAYVGEIRLTKTATVKAVLKERGKTLGDVVSQQFTVTTTGIDGIGSDATGGVSVDGNSIIAPVGSQAFDMTGRRVSLTGLRQGVYIVRLPDGTALKVSIR